MSDATFPSLRGKGAVITGGASGIGAAMVEAFARQGAHVRFCDIAADAGHALARRLKAEGLEAAFERIDVTDRTALMGFVSGSAPRLSILINNAASDDRHRLEAVSADYFAHSLSINFEHAFWAIQAAAPALRANAAGSIITLSSINMILGQAEMPLYVAMKAALVGLTKSVARELGPYGVRANAILPGWIVTERQRALWLSDEAEAEHMKHVALKRRLLPEDVARLALFLAADDSSAITGQALVIDGGRT